jgi:hypothetical protein
MTHSEKLMDIIFPGHHFDVETTENAAVITWYQPAIKTRLVAEMSTDGTIIVGTWKNSEEWLELARTSVLEIIVAKSADREL